MMLRHLIHPATAFVVLALSIAPAHAKLDLPDPTRPGSFTPQLATSTMPMAKQFKLHSVLVSSQRRVAIINNKSVEEGDSVDGATVRQIEKSRVVLIKQGTSFSLNLLEHDFKQRK